MMLNLKKESLAGSLVCLLAMAGVATAGNVNVGVEVVTPNVRVRASNTPPPPPPRSVTVVERETVIVKEKDDHHDNGRHRGHDKKHKKHKKHEKHDDD